MLQMTDIHYDQRYIENGTVYYDTHLCCHEPASNYSRIKSGKIGNLLNCDICDNTLKSFVQAVYELQENFIIWTGDNTEHDNWNNAQEEVYETTAIIKEAIDEEFGNSIPVYP